MVTMIAPGDLRVELRLETLALTPDGAGGFSESWTETGLVFAMVEPASARDRFGAGQTLEEVTHRITIRHRADIASGMRLRRGVRVFDIRTVNDPDETGRYLVLKAREQGK